MSQNNNGLLFRTSLFFAVWLFLPLSSSAAPIQNETLRYKLAQVYAPEIRQDREEIYGLASVGHFLRRSRLMTSIRGCQKRRGKASPRFLGPGTQLLLHDRIVWQQHDCRRVFSMFSHRKIRHGKQQILPAKKFLYLQLQDHTDKTLLRHFFSHGKIIPEISFHAYETQQLDCLKRGWYGRCKQYKASRFYVLQFFVMLMMNRACNVHEGEQEGMMLLIDANQFDAAESPEDFRQAVLKVGYYAHYKTSLHTPNQVEFVEGTHPVAYMGKGGHGLYPKAGLSDMLKSFPREMRVWVKRICHKKGLSSFLQERHRGGGRSYQAWKGPSPLPIEQALSIFDVSLPLWKSAFPWPLFWKDTLCPHCDVPQSLPTQKPKFEPPSIGLSNPSFLKHQQRLFVSQLLPMQDLCIDVGQRSHGVRLCDVQGGSAHSPCCFRRKKDGYVRWVQFAGRWGRQERFASGLVGDAAAQLGRVMKRWPLGRSFGNSGPFGPKFIHSSTWNWFNLKKKPIPTLPTWR